MKQKQIKNTRKMGRIAPIVAAIGIACLAPSMARAQEYTNAVVNNITNDMKLTWNWIDMYQFGTESSSGGTITGTTNGWYDSGTTISNNAVADDHKVFQYWTGLPDGVNSNDNPVVFALGEPCTNVTAVFDWDSHNLDVQSVYGSPTGAGTYKHGSSATSQVERVIEAAPGVRRRVTGYTLEDL